MAHLQKFTQADYPKLLMHYERAKDENGDYHKFRNQDIDLSRTYQNYNLAKFIQPLPQSEFMDKRLGELKIFKRGDVKYMCDWIITLPKGMEPQEYKFFDAVFKFLSGKYGQKNVVSAYVHKDEVQPHMHFAFVPVAMDKKKNIEKLCSKDIVGRDDLFAFHDELDKYLTGVFGYDTGVRNGATKDGNKSIDELKRGTAVKKLKEIREARAAEEKRIEKLKVGGDRIKPVKEKGDNVLIAKADLETANNALIQKNWLDERTREAEMNARLDKEIYRRESDRLWDDSKELKTKLTELTKKNDTLSKRVQWTDKVFDNNPKLLEEFLRVSEELARIEAIEERIARAARIAETAEQQLEKRPQMEMG